MLRQKRRLEDVPHTNNKKTKIDLSSVLYSLPVDHSADLCMQVTELSKKVDLLLMAVQRISREVESLSEKRELNTRSYIS